MYSSVLFWVDVALSSIAGLAASHVLFLVFGLGLRQRLNRALALFSAAVALTSLCSVTAGLALWADTGNPEFWTGLAVLGFYFVGPALSALAVVLAERRAKWVGIAIVLGLMAGLGFIFPLLNQQLTSNVLLDGASLYHSEPTPWGSAGAAVSLLYGLFALALLWLHRRQHGSYRLVLGTALLLAGGLFRFLLQSPFPTLGPAFVAGYFWTGFHITNRHIIEPLRSINGQPADQTAQGARSAQRIKDSLQRQREQYLRAVSISRDIVQIKDPSAIPQRLIDSVHNSFGYHHVYIYQPDEANEHLVVQAAAGTTARTVLESRHRVRIGGPSLAGQAAAEGRPRWAEARGKDTVFFGDTALPGARSEMALPLVVGERLLGIIDVQSIHFEAFSDDDIAVMTFLADLAAVFLFNSQLLQTAEAKLVELEEMQRGHLLRAWKSNLDGQGRQLAYAYTANGDVKPISFRAAWSPEVAQAVAEDQPIVDLPGSENPRDLAAHTAELGQTIALPLRIRGQAIGALKLQRKSGDTWHRSEIRTLTEFVERLGMALETAWLTEESQRRAARERVVSEVTARVRRTLDTETVLKTAVDEIYRALELDELAIHLSPQYRRQNGP